MNELNSPGSSGKLLGRALAELAAVIERVTRAQLLQAEIQKGLRRRDSLWRNWRTAVLGASVLGGVLFYRIRFDGFLSLNIPEDPCAALVRIEGVIDSDSPANAHRIKQWFKHAFADSRGRGVVLPVNLSGASPVQAGLMHDRLHALKLDRPQKPLVVVGADYLIRGTYYIAVAASHICVNRSTMIGSIGIVMQGWGLDRAIEKFGIEHRIVSAVNNKVRLDPCRPVTTAHRDKAPGLMEAIHAQLFDAVRAGSGTRLQGTAATLWSGDYWRGAEAVALGMVDRLGDLKSVFAEDMGAMASQTKRRRPMGGCGWRTASARTRSQRGRQGTAPVNLG